MVSGRALKNKGKVSFSRYFQTFDEGDRVALVKERGTTAHFSPRVQGKTGVILSRRGTFYLIEFKDLGKTKHLIVHPINLRRVGARV